MNQDSTKNDVIIATDGSDAALNAVKYAGFLLHPNMHRLVPLRVIKEPTEIFWKADQNDESEETLQEIEQEARMELQTEFEDLERDFEVDMKVLRGEPENQICEVADELNALGIVMGHRKFAGRKDVLLGSVSNYVTHNAPCPVTVVPRLDDLSGRNKIIVASDGTEAARNALGYVSSLLHPDKHQLVALRVIEPPSEAPWQAGSQTGDVSDVLEDMERKARRQLGSDFEGLESEGFDVERKVLRGKPQDSICQLADETNALGILIGRREFDDREEVLLGSVSNYVAHNAPCPVSVVPRDRF